MKKFLIVATMLFAGMVASADAYAGGRHHDRGYRHNRGGEAAAVIMGAIVLGAILSQQQDHLHHRHTRRGSRAPHHSRRSLMRRGGHGGGFAHCEAYRGQWRSDCIRAAADDYAWQEEEATRRNRRQYQHRRGPSW